MYSDESDARAPGIRPSLLRCTDCGALWLSPRGALLVESGEPCLRCDGSLVVEDRDEDGVGVTRKIWDAWASRDLDKLISHCHPEVEMRTAPGIVVPDRPGVYDGHAGLRRFFEDAACHMIPQELRAFGDRVLTLGKLIRQAPAPGGESLTVGWVFRIRGGKALSCRAYVDPAEALDSLEAESP